MTIAAKVTIICGCPVQPAGVWDSKKFEIAALIKKDGRSAGVLSLKYAGTPCQFNDIFKEVRK
jgi:hypothetical protein